MTTPTYAVRDAITGNAVTADPHRQWVLLDSGNEDIWLTPTTARRLAADLLTAANEVEADQ